MAKAKSTDQLPLNVSSTEIYDVSEPCRGYAVIIANFRFFDKQLDIEASEDDTLTLTKTFAQMQFKVENHNNVTAQEIVDLMRSYRKKDQSNYGCFVCVLLSRGLGDSICGSDGVFVSVPELLNSFADCVFLEGKPKFVFIDACRFVFEPFRVHLPQRCRDFLICSIRTENLENTMDRPDWKFSTFFDALCHVFRDWGEKAEIDELLEEIKQAVQKNSNQLQTIEIKQNLTKKSVFTPGWRICKHCTSCINTKICTKCISNERRLAVAELTLEKNIVKSMQNSRSTNFSMKPPDQFQTKYSDNEIARPCSAAKEELERVKNATVVRRITSENYQSAQEIITDPGVSNLKLDTVKFPAEPRTSQEHQLSSAVRKREQPYITSSTESIATTNTLCDTPASNEIRIVLVGRTGAGKSATGNFVMGKKYFESKLSGNSVTQKCKRGECTISGRNVVIVDTPGIFDTRISSEILSAEIIRCIHMSIPGPHVFLLVVQIARFTAEEIESFNRLFDLFGEQMGNFACLGFTRLDDLERDNSTIDEYIKSSPEILTQFLQRCRGSFFAFNNNESNESNRREMVTNFSKVVDDIIKRNGGQHYTNGMYKEAEEQLRQKILAVERQKAEEKEMEITKIESKYTVVVDDMKRQNDNLKKNVAQMESNSAEIKRQKESVMAEVINLKIERDQAKQREAKEKEQFYAKLEAKEEKMNVIIKQLNQQKQDIETQRKKIENQKNKEIADFKATHEQSLELLVQRLTEGNKNAIQSINMQHEQQMQKMGKFLSQSQESNKKYAVALEALQGTIKAQNASIAKLENQNSRLERQYESQSRILDRQREEIRKANDSSCCIS